MIGILQYLDTPTTRLEWTLALTCAATGMRGDEIFGLKWQDINFNDGRIKICRGWSKGVETEGKNPGSMTSVAMHPALAAYLKEWRQASLYAHESHWVFPSTDAKGHIPRAASTMAKKYLRPAAVSAGVLAEEDMHTRFGWHSLRHSLATYFGSLNVPVTVVQRALRHASSRMTARHIHAVPTQQEQLQGAFLEALKLSVGVKTGVN